MFKGPSQAATALGFGQPSAWTTLPGGRTNRLVLGAFADGKRVFKFFNESRSNPLFPNAIDDEQNALEALAGTGLAPTPRGRVNTDFGACIVYDFVDGAVPEQTSIDTIKALSRLHAQKPGKGMRQIFGDPADIVKQGLSFIADDHSDRAAKLRNSVPEVPKLKPASVCFLHADPTPANSIMTPQGITFVDWQCPATGDPVHDLAIALSPAMHVVDGAEPLQPTQIERFLDAYGDAGVTQRYRALSPLYHWRMACYCQWKAQAGAAEFAAAGLAEVS